MLPCRGLEYYLDKLARTEFHILHSSWSTFKVCGLAGMALAIALSLSLAIYQGLSLWVIAGIILTAELVLLGLTMAAKVVTGEERIVYIQHLIAVMLVVTALLWLWGQPILPYLDITILGVALVVAVGRVGCLMVGCCHGQPARWGVSYGEEHAAAGLPPYLVGVRLFPVQAVEALWLLGTVIVGSFMVLRGNAAGDALAWYIISYNSGRFFIEFARGDPARPYLWGFSAAQWMSVLLMLVVAGVELSGLLPFHAWHLGVVVLVAITMVVVAVRGWMRGPVKAQLLSARHIQEVAGAVGLASELAIQGCDICGQGPGPSPIHIGCTSLGVQISSSRIKSASGYIHHYAISQEKGEMSETTAAILGNLLIKLRHQSGFYEYIRGNNSVFHLVVHPEPAVAPF